MIDNNLLYNVKTDFFNDFYLFRLQQIKIKRYTNHFQNYFQKGL